DKTQRGGDGSQVVTVDVLAYTIQNMAAAPSWQAVGGPGAITVLGQRLIVNQTREVHAAIEKFLAALRADGGAHGTVTVKAWWLRLDNGQYQNLLGEMPA